MNSAHSCKSKPSPIGAALFNMSATCPDCGRKVKVSGALHFLAVMFAVLCFALAAVLSIKIQSWWPYLPSAVLVIASQFWLAYIAPRVFVR